MNKFEFYLWSFVSTVGQGLNYVTHRGQYAILDRVIDVPKTYYKAPAGKVIRNNGRKGRG